MKTKINAQIVAHSINEQGDELISVLATFPRIILAEVNTHRMLSKNTSSSRAIPFNKMVETVKNDPFIPIAWQKHHSGMQGNEYLDTLNSHIAKEHWLKARDNAILEATLMNRYQVTKQLCNRLLEPFMWTTMLITGPKSGWDNFFKLRCPQYVIPSSSGVESTPYKSRKDVIKYLQVGAEENYWHSFTDLDFLKMNKGQAEIHIMELAECIWDAYNESTPRVLKAGQWHIPFEDRLDETELFKTSNLITKKERPDLYPHSTLSRELTAVRISVAMAARTSYTVVGEEKALDFEAMIGLHDRLLAQDPPHSSPLEHAAKCMSEAERQMYRKVEKAKSDSEGLGWCNNLKGFIPYRYMVDNGKVD